MGARIGKLISDLDSYIEAEPNRFDLEQGGDSSTTSYDSDLSSIEGIEDYDSQIEENATDPYYVEKRFIAGTNSFEYNIIKRK